MLVVAGLGNPGVQYALTRHNAGFMAVELLAARHGFPVWMAKFKGLASLGDIDGKRVLLLKPHTFMNLSGESVSAVLRFYKTGPNNLLVVHDELDFPFGEARLKRGGRSAGHK